MIKEAQALTKRFPSLVVKVPVTAQGLIAIKSLTALGITTLGTAVYGAGQGLLSALAGAKYVAPYVNRIDAQSGSGIDVVNELQTLLTLHAPSSMILAASFRTPRQALDCLLAGSEANLRYYQRLMAEIREAVAKERYEEFVTEFYQRIGKSAAPFQLR